MAKSAEVVAIIERPTADDRPAEDEGPTRPTPPVQPGGLLKNLARLAIGSALLGVSATRRYLAEWERTLAQPDPDQSANAHVLRPAELWEAPAGETTQQRLRHAAIGLLFESQDRLVAGQRTADRLSRRLYHNLTRPVSRLPFPRPLRRRYDALIQRGEEELDRLVSRGRAETAHSEALAAVGLRDLLDDWIDLLAENEQLKELVHEQSVGLADEAIEEVRERTVTGDILVERLARRLLRLPPREILPQPTEIIRELNQAQEQRKQK